MAHATRCLQNTLLVTRRVIQALTPLSHRGADELRSNESNAPEEREEESPLPELTHRKH